MKNPILAIREEHGLSRTEFGVITGIVAETVRQLETGIIKKPAPCVLEGLERMGYDAEQVLKEMEKWRDAYKEELISKVLAR